MSTKKKLIRWVVLLTAAAVVAVLLWPQSFAKLVVKDRPMAVTLTETEEDGVCYLFEPGSEEFRKIEEILSRYSYHCSWRTFFDHPSIEGEMDGFWLDVTVNMVGKRNNMICGGTDEVIVNYKVYRIGYWGNKTALAMMEEIRQVLPE